MPSTDILRVHVIFKTHLDLGFTGLARDVKQRYFAHYIPQAIAVARDVRAQQPNFQFVWTTGS
jgi:hypothetical protein